MSDFLVMALESDAELYHHGIEGQKWGERRYQNYDGSLTDEGRKRYGVGKARKEAKKSIRQLEGNVAQSLYNKNRAEKDLKKITKRLDIVSSRASQTELTDKLQKDRDNMTKMYDSILRDLDKNAASYKNAVDQARAEFGKTKIKDVKYNKKTGDMKVRLPGQDKYNKIGLAYAFLGPNFAHVGTVPIAILISNVGPKLEASKEYKNLKDSYNS